MLYTCLPLIRKRDNHHVEDVIQSIHVQVSPGVIIISWGRNRKMTSRPGHAGPKILCAQLRHTLCGTKSESVFSYNL